MRCSYGDRCILKRQCPRGVCAFSHHWDALKDERKEDIEKKVLGELVTEALKQKPI